ncbi:FliM/FliN family flagellar motor switch protein [Sphingomonas sp. PAMC 26617]|uniref:FliM/FliN family flagellar motor switch protein n=1 Tax=Sphingomonas sp. PAMC 26617 TaxID=1112216 RepID=UPI000289C70B|nr:FliM/FliN family flagellar motor switch protein [Sphingomonas sp. PAMC 26617]
MSVLESVPVEVSIVLGAVRLPIRQVLKMSRGATIAFDCGHEEPSRIYANGTLVAKGRIQVTGERMAIEVTEVVPRGVES